MSFDGRTAGQVCRFLPAGVKSPAKMKTLYILRHAKSSWDDHSLTDHERPLNERGRRTAPFIGGLMKERDMVPDAIVSSPAVRAKQTAELVREAAGFEPEIKFNERIYEASVGTLMTVITEFDNEADRALLVGHNPGAEGLIYYLTGEIAPMPTAALAIIELNIGSWAEIEDGRGILSRVIRPKDEMPD